MSTPESRGTNRAFTLLELLVVLVIVFILVSLILPMHSDAPRKAYRVLCMSNLSQIGVGCLMFADDQTNDFPWHVANVKADLEGPVRSNHISTAFALLSPYLPNPRAFICPTDSRKPATNYVSLGNTNISYFVNLDAGTNAVKTFAAGDRNIQFNNTPLHSGQHTLQTNSTFGWTRELHPKGSPYPGGNLLFCDGHVEWSRTNFTHLVVAQGFPAARLAVP
jgi:prepilin-type processing-associated H-X9-DG protein/prepilin-type N-terminal cleavage/methylation domain-containing protein